MTKRRPKDAPKVGRPTKYDPAYCEKVIQLGKEGKSLAQIASTLDVDRSTFTNWEATHKEFFRAVKKSQLHAQAWWEDAGQSGIHQGKEFNATAFIFQVKNRFREDYKDKQEMTHVTNFSGVFEALGQASKRTSDEGQT